MPKLFAAPKPGFRSPSWILFDTDTAYLVDKNGKRFCNEHESRYAGCALACFRQNIDGAYVVLDEATVTGPNKERWRYADLLSAKALFEGRPLKKQPQKPVLIPRGCKERFRELQTIPPREKGTRNSDAKTNFSVHLKGLFMSQRRVGRFVSRRKADWKSIRTFRY